MMILGAETRVCWASLSDCVIFCRREPPLYPQSDGGDHTHALLPRWKCVRRDVGHGELGGLGFLVQAPVGLKEGASREHNLSAIDNGVMEWPGKKHQRVSRYSLVESSKLSSARSVSPFRLERMPQDPHRTSSVTPSNYWVHVSLGSHSDLPALRHPDCVSEDPRIRDFLLSISLELDQTEAVGDEKRSYRRIQDTLAGRRCHQRW